MGPFFERSCKRMGNGLVEKERKEERWREKERMRWDRLHYSRQKQ